MSMQTASGARSNGNGAHPPVYLHVGLQKTGMTGFQAAFDLRRAELHRAGLLYAATGVQAHNHFDIAQAFLSARPVAEEQREHIRAALRTEMARSEVPLLISCEHFSDATEADIRALAAFFGRGTRIIVTLEQQVAWTSAMYAEAIRWGHRIGFEPFLEGFRLCLDYEALLRRWEAAFGRANIRVVPRTTAGASPGAVLLAALLPQGGFEGPVGPDAAEAALPAPLVHLQGCVSPDLPDGAAVVEPGLRSLAAEAVRQGFRLPAEWRIPDRFTKDFLALDRSNDRISRDFGLPFPLFGRTVRSLIDDNHRLGYAAASPFEWFPQLPQG